MRYIDLIETSVTTKKRARRSSLGMGTEGLWVIGVLPHGYAFRPATAKHRDALVRYLTDLEYPS